MKKNKEKKTQAVILAGYNPHRHTRPYTHTMQEPDTAEAPPKQNDPQQVGEMWTPA